MGLNTGKIILDLIPKIYDTERVMRIIGDDGKHELVTVNQQTADANGVSRVLNDLTVGEYDVVMDTGPGFNSKRQEAVTAMMPLISSNQQLFQLAGDLVFRNMDFPGADVIADRLAEYFDLVFKSPGNYDTASIVVALIFFLR